MSGPTRRWSRPLNSGAAAQRQAVRLLQPKPDQNHTMPMRKNNACMKCGTATTHRSADLPLCSVCLPAVENGARCAVQVRALESYLAALYPLLRAHVKSPESSHAPGQPDFIEAVTSAHLRALMYSFVVLAVSCLEVGLMEFARSVADRAGAKAPAKPRRDIIMSLRRSLKSMLPALNDRADVWKRIADLTVLRNCIVHDSGNIDGCSHSDDIKSMIGGFPGLSINSRRIELGLEVGDFATRQIRECYQLLCEAAGFGKIPFIPTVRHSTKAIERSLTARWSRQRA